MFLICLSLFSLHNHHESTSVMTHSRLKYIFMWCLNAPDVTVHTSLYTASANIRHCIAADLNALPT
jgi:hypothetical protein